MVEFITNGEYLVNKPLLNPFCCILPDRGTPASPLRGEDHHTLHDQVPESQSVGDTCPPDQVWLVHRFVGRLNLLQPPFRFMYVNN